MGRVRAGDESVDELRASRGRVLAAADEERRRIERELHDGPLQQLVALAVDLQLAKGLLADGRDGLEELLDEMGRNVREAIDDVRRLAWRVYPSVLDDGGLREALRGAAAAATVPTTVDVPAARPAPEIEAAVYFCCAELLDEARDGERATVRVRSAGETTTFEVTVRGARFEDWAARDLRRLGDRVGAPLSVTPAEGGVRVSGELRAGQALLAE